MAICDAGGGVGRGADDRADGVAGRGAVGSHPRGGGGKQLAGGGRRGPEQGRPGLITDPEGRNWAWPALTSTPRLHESPVTGR